MVYNILVISLAAHALNNGTKGVETKVAVLVAGLWSVAVPSLFPGSR